MTSFHLCVTGPSNDILLVIINWQPYAYQDGLSALFAASSNGHSEIVRILILGGADIDALNKVSNRICMCYRLH